MQSAMRRLLGTSTSTSNTRRLRSRPPTWRRTFLVTATAAVLTNTDHNNNIMATAFSTSSSHYCCFQRNSHFSHHQHHHPDKTRRLMLSSSSSSSSSSSENPRDSNIFNRAPPEDHPIIDHTLSWVKGSVIGLNFCPFAERPYNSKQLFMEVIHGTDQSEILARVLAECLVRQKRPGTSLMICPDLFPTNFYAYLEIYNMLQDGILVDHELSEDLQIAPFHPYFEFEAEGGQDGIDNYTNRSPYPIFHILREEEVDVAVDALDGDASRVWKRNIRLLEELSKEFERDQLEQMVRSGVMPISSEGGGEEEEVVKQKVKEILKKLKKEKS